MLLQLLSDVLCINNGIGIWRMAPQEELGEVLDAFFINALYKRDSFYNSVEEEYDDDDDDGPFLKREEWPVAVDVSGIRE
ncbi:hypothetical protein IAQ61_000223 [Plenodomus lingam]|uniref:uncharacterized protein n=1 Tax=Leptosphaeria maculans TaxID=5022 RepID=UPI003317DE75|nr:hypothetical protein IAQ61_000223 [Plenodomus lingam]